VIENKGIIEALIHLNMEYLQNRLKGKIGKDYHSAISEILEDIRNHVNQRLPDFSRIKRCFFHNEPFIKTATQKIKRYLYHPSAVRKQNN
jgi:long-chain acyl-CoA synthetase